MYFIMPSQRATWDRTCLAFSALFKPERGLPVRSFPSFFSLLSLISSLSHFSLCPFVYLPDCLFLSLSLMQHVQQTTTSSAMVWTAESVYQERVTVKVDGVALLARQVCFPSSLLTVCLTSLSFSLSLSLCISLSLSIYISRLILFLTSPTILSVEAANAHFDPITGDSEPDDGCKLRLLDYMHHC